MRTMTIEIPLDNQTTREKFLLNRAHNFTHPLRIKFLDRVWELTDLRLLDNTRLHLSENGKYAPVAERVRPPYYSLTFQRI